MNDRIKIIGSQVLLLCLFIITTKSSNAQSTGVYIPAASAVYMPPGASATIWGDALQLDGQLIMQDSTTTINFKGTAWVNSSSAAITSGKVIMNGDAAQNITGSGAYNGTGVSFSRLQIDNLTGVSLTGSDIRIDSGLFFNQGLLFTNTKDVILGEAAFVAGTKATSFAVVNDGGGISKYLTGDKSFAFPSGSANNGGVYNPIQLNVKAQAASYSSLSYVRVTLKDSVNAYKSPIHNNYGKKYWVTNFKNLVIDSADYTALYNNNDAMVGDTSRIVGSDYSAGRWWFRNSGRVSGGGLTITGRINSDAEIFGQDRLLQAGMKFYLQGAWNGTGMHTKLRNAGLVPLSQPYGVAPYNVANFNYTGLERRTSLPTNVVDWVLLELRSDTTGPAIARTAALLLNDGTVTDGFVNGPPEFKGVPDGNYYLVVRHRNHLGAMSRYKVFLPNNGLYDFTKYSLPDADSYDFTTDTLKAYGNNFIMAPLSGGKYGLWGGNVVPDNAVQTTGILAKNDYSKIQGILNAIVRGSTTLFGVYNQADINLDGAVKTTGIITANDYSLLQEYIGATSTSIIQAFK